MSNYLRLLDFLTVITIFVHTAAVLLVELHLALPTCIKAYYPSQVLLNPLQRYISITNDCLAESPPVWARVSTCVAAIITPALLFMLPAVIKGGRPSLRCPLMLLTTCLAIVDAQLWLHYFFTEKLCSAETSAAGKPPGPVDIRPVLLFHGFRFAGSSLTAVNLLFQEAWGKRRGGSSGKDNTGAAVTTRSKAAAARKKAK